MEEFINWETLATYGGSLAFVMVLTQFFKELTWSKNVPTQLLSYILSFLVLVTASYFTSGLTLQVLIECIFNGIIVSLGANGGYSAMKRVSTPTTQGDIFVVKEDPKQEKPDDIYLALNSLKALEQSTVNLKVVNKNE